MDWSRLIFVWWKELEEKQQIVEAFRVEQMLKLFEALREQEEAI